MHNDTLTDWLHEHVFDEGSQAAERGTRLVMWITLGMMFVEIFAGWWFNSMALLADGWHMSSHALAIGLSATAYVTARTYARDPRFAFGSWKIEVLAGFASAIVLLGVALMMVFGSIDRIWFPQPIQYAEAIAVAVLGLVVNVVCALILGRAHYHPQHDAQSKQHSAHAEHEKPHVAITRDPHHGHGHGHGHHHDLNLKSAYVHVIADAFTSVLAIVALLGGWWYGWSWLDPVMGLVGAVLVAVWARGLLADTGKVLLDREMDHPVVEEIRKAIETSPQTRVTDLHVWRVGKQVFSCALTVVTQEPDLTPDMVRERLSVHKEIVHSTIEIHRYQRKS
ncbi:MAG: CDF family Co(II)/Ni(II) efflux transporter DmeF [Burkholderiales bacterium]|nr:CDF family Co(II)/Ni(II) efflux transporter DmeF [Burkholderiales bacterium]